MSIDNDDEAEMQKIMGFGNFQGTKRTPKHENLPTGRSKRGAKVSTGANSQPVSKRQHHMKPAPTPLLENPEKSIPEPAIKHDAQSPPAVTPVSEIARPLDESIDASGLNADPKAEQPHLDPQPEDLPSTTDTSQSPHFPHVHPTAIVTNYPASTHGYRNNRNCDPNATGWSNIETGKSFTNAQLDVLAQGTSKITKVDSNGKEYQVPVYFMPSFVEDDPWAGLDIKPRPKNVMGAPSRSWR